MIDYKRLTMAFFKGWMMAFGAIMAIYAAFVAAWLKCEAFRNWLTSKFVAATLDTIDDSYESFSERLEAM